MFAQVSRLGRVRGVRLGGLLLLSAAVFWLSPSAPGRAEQTLSDDLVVFGYNELGMHCMNQDCSEFMLLPPFNSLRAQVIDRGAGEDPQIVTSGITIRYAIQGNTHSADKTSFWKYVKPLLGVDLPPNIGLGGLGLTGTMSPTGENDWVATGIPITPINDAGREDPFPLATIEVLRSGKVVARTQAVVPVSWEINCQLCHNTPGVSVATDILQKHDQLHGTDLVNQKPVLCAGCHADPVLGAPGKEGVSTLSSAMHGAHATRMDKIDLPEKCYACHPGVRTQCQRDIHFAKNILCTDCHGSMADVGDPKRKPWSDEPRCGNCHQRQGFEFEQPNTLYRHSLGHSSVHCVACHNSPHAITPTVTDVDNLQAERLQGHTGVINTCSVCHSQTPDGPFFHRQND